MLDPESKFQYPSSCIPKSSISDPLLKLLYPTSCVPAPFKPPKCQLLKASLCILPICIQPHVLKLMYPSPRVPAPVSPPICLLSHPSFCIFHPVCQLLSSSVPVFQLLYSQLLILSLRCNSRILGPQSTPNSCITHFMSPNLCIYDFTYISSFSLLSVSHALVQYPSIYPPGQVSSSLLNFWICVSGWNPNSFLSCI
jgi:hypothetical protein